MLNKVGQRILNPFTSVIWKRQGTEGFSSVVDPDGIFSNPDPTFQIVSDLDPVSFYLCIPVLCVKFPFFTTRYKLSSGFFEKEFIFLLLSSLLRNSQILSVFQSTVVLFQIHFRSGDARIRNHFFWIVIDDEIKAFSRFFVEELIFLCLSILLRNSKNFISFFE